MVPTACLYTQPLTVMACRWYLRFTAVGGRLALYRIIPTASVDLKTNQKEQNLDFLKFTFILSFRILSRTISFSFPSLQFGSIRFHIGSPCNSCGLEERLSGAYSVSLYSTVNSYG